MPNLLLALFLVGALADPPDRDNLARIRPEGGRSVVLIGVGEDTVPRGEWRVLCDRNGPGVLQSILIHSGPSGDRGRLRIFFDGGERPTLDTTLQDLAAGRAPGFPEPLAGTCSGVVYAAAPIPFRNGLRVEFLGEDLRDYRIAIQEGTSGDPAEDPDLLAARWAHPDTRKYPGEVPAEFPVDVAARSTTVFLLPPGPRTIRTLEVRPTAGTADAWRDARLRLRWESDDPEPADVDLPLGMAFGRLGGLGISGTPMMGDSEGGTSWRNRFPMPYRVQGLLRIDTDRALKGSLRLRSVPTVDRDAGYFRGSNLAPAEAGRGHLAGVFEVGGSTVGAARLIVDGKDLGPWEQALGLPPIPGGARGSGVIFGTIEGTNREFLGRYRWMSADPITYHLSLRLERSSGRAEERRNPTGTRAAWFWYSERPRSGPPAIVPTRRSD